MRYRIFVLLLGLLCLSGCGWIQDEYASVQEHKEPYVYVETQTEAPVPAVTNAAELRAQILSFVFDGVAKGQIDVRDYPGDLQTQVVQVLSGLRRNPVYAYAVDYSDYAFAEDEASGSRLLEISMIYRRSADEIAGIIDVRGMQAAEQKIISALNTLDAATTLKIDSYQDMDFPAFIRQYCLEHPQTLAVPEVKVSVYPDSGLTRVVEIHYLYEHTRNELRSRLETIGTMLSSAATYVRYRSNHTEEKLSLLCAYLLNRNSYTPGASGDTPAYALLNDQLATAEGFASVFCSTARQVGVDCYLISGTKNGEAHYWNAVQIDGAYSYLDLMQLWQDGVGQLQLLTQEQLQAYAWEAGQLPEG